MSPISCSSAEQNMVKRIHKAHRTQPSGKYQFLFEPQEFWKAREVLFLFRGKRGTVQMGKTQLQQFVSGNNRFILGWKALWGVWAILRLELTLSLQQPQDSTPVWKCSWCSHMGFSCWQRNSLICYRNLHSPPSVTSVYCEERYSSRET